MSPGPGRRECPTKENVEENVFSGVGIQLNLPAKTFPSYRLTA
jgi:hypothetical protein